jgi:N-hydroxyarylamine O-acetyltransferase
VRPERLLDRYFERIGYCANPRVDLETLTSLHRLHLASIPYENLDVQSGIPVSIATAHAFEKLVMRRRGGWCYEMNGLFSLVLEALGFQLTRVAAGTAREFRGDSVLGNHLVLIVHLDRDYLVDVGFAEGSREPLPLQEGEYRWNGFSYGLRRVAAGYWRFINHARAAVPSFDFKVAAADTALLASQSTWLQTAQQSPFVRTALCFVVDDEGISALRDTAFRRIDDRGVHECVLADCREYQVTLQDVFDLHLEPSQLEKVWSGIAHRAELREQALQGGATAG